MSTASPSSIVADEPSAATTELVRFLVARLDDDHAGYKRAARKRSAARTAPGPLAGLPDLDRLRAEVEAKRQLLGVLQQQLVLRDQPFEKVIRHQAVHMLRAMATVYSDHPRYRSEWGLAAPM